jgi:hypothetical protein
LLRSSPERRAICPTPRYGHHRSNQSIRKSSIWLLWAGCPKPHAGSASSPPAGVNHRGARANCRSAEGRSWKTKVCGTAGGKCTAIDFVSALHVWDSLGPRRGLVSTIGHTSPNGTAAMDSGESDPPQRWGPFFPWPLRALRNLLLRARIVDCVHPASAPDGTSITMRRGRQIRCRTEPANRLATRPAP